MAIDPKIEPNPERTSYHLSKEGFVHAAETLAGARSEPQGQKLPWTRETLMRFGRDCCDEALALAHDKNTDYARGSDPFRNLRRGGPFGIVVRMDDKISRLMSLLEPGAEDASVTDEPIGDTVIDLINYCWLLLALRQEQSEQ